MRPDEDGDVRAEVANGIAPLDELEGEIFLLGFSAALEYLAQQDCGGARRLGTVALPIKRTVAA